MDWLYITLGVIAGLVLIFLGILYFIYYNSFYSPHKGQNNDYFLTPKTLEYTTEDKIYPMIDKLKAIPFEEAYITSFDKKKLFARIYENKNSNKVVIMCHGYRGTAYRDFSGGAYDMITSGYNVILIDERAHGKSGGHSITFGVKEKRDLASWLEFAKKRFGEDKQTILVGISMGGATVLLASNLLKEGDKVIADCPYITPRSIISETLESTLKMNPKFFYPIANMASIIYGHANLSKDDASKSIKESKAKFLIATVVSAAQ